MYGGFAGGICDKFGREAKRVGQIGSERIFVASLAAQEGGGDKAQLVRASVAAIQECLNLGMIVASLVAIH